MRTVTTRDGFSSKDAADRTATEKTVSLRLTEFLQANSIGPGEIIISGRSETPGGYIHLHLALYTDQTEFATRGYPFRLNVA